VRTPPTEEVVKILDQRFRILVIEIKIQQKNVWRCRAREGGETVGTAMEDVLPPAPGVAITPKFIDDMKRMHEVKVKGLMNSIHMLKQHLAVYVLALSARTS
jgi:hypothetical protein